MAEPKTKPTNQDPKTFIATRAPDKYRTDAIVLLDLFTQATGEQPVMWGESIIGFGRYSYLSGKTSVPWPLVAFSPRATSLTLYVNAGLPAHAELITRIGPAKVSGSCLHLKSLTGIDEGVLKSLIASAYSEMKTRHGG